jgi:mannose-6-phosphate isomerase
MNKKSDPLYPIELSLSRFKKTWGGWPGKIGEILSLSCHPYESIALNGFLAGRRLREIVGEFQQKLLGADIELDPREPFPFLLRFISTTINLPIQVHPDDTYALEEGLPMVGRDKIFYILSAKPGARLYSGFSKKIDKKTIIESVSRNSLYNLLNPVTVEPGHVYTMPAGRIHSIGKGIALLEIQRHSDLNFILAESDDIEKEKSHNLPYLSEALKVLDLNPTDPEPIKKFSMALNNNFIEWLGLTPNLFVRRISVRGCFELSLKGNRFLVYTGIRGIGCLRWGLTDISVLIQPGQSILVPAIAEDILFESEGGMDIIESSIPDLGGDTLEQMVNLGITADSIAALGGKDYRKIIQDCL